MKQLLLVLIMLGCGIPPIPPIPPVGCIDLKPVCICDSEGNCDWQYQCIN